MGRALHIQPATCDDIAGLMELYAHLSSDNLPCPDAQARKNLMALEKYPGSAVLLGLCDGAPIATCTLVVIPNLTRAGASYAVIENVVTHPAHRGQGHGTSLLDAASERAWDHGCYKIMLSTGSKRPATLAFYERAGFEQSRTGFQKRRHPSRPDAAPAPIQMEVPHEV